MSSKTVRNVESVSFRFKPVAFGSVFDNFLVLSVRFFVTIVCNGSTFFEY